MARILIAFGFIVIVLLSSCHKCQNNAGIEMSELLELHTSRRDINYCDILSEAIELDSSSIIQLFTLEIQDGAVYDHAIVLKEVTEYFGESILLGYESAFTVQERYNVAHLLRLGLEYPLAEQKKLEDHFPELATWWK